MKHLKTGKYLSCRNRSFDVNGLIVSDTEYLNAGTFPMHYHQNLYLAYVVNGNYTERNKRERFSCLPGSVVFHNAGEEHSNSDFAGYNRILNLEITSEWLLKHEIEPCSVESNVKTNNIDLQCCMNRIMTEYAGNDAASNLEIESQVFKIIAQILSSGNIYQSGIPKWVKIVKEFINESSPELFTLCNLSELTGVHAVHLSRDFHRYFNSSFGEYVRKVMIERSKNLLCEPVRKLADIAFECGYSDQSHFTRQFRKFTGITPMEYRRRVLFRLN